MVYQITKFTMEASLFLIQGLPNVTRAVFHKKNLLQRTEGHDKELRALLKENYPFPHKEQTE